MHCSESEYEYLEYVTIMETKDLALIALIKSIFEDAGIRYFINGESLLGLGRAVIEAKIQVERSDVETALELIKELGE